MLRGASTLPNLLPKRSLLMDIKPLLIGLVISSLFGCDSALSQAKDWSTEPLAAVQKAAAQGDAEAQLMLGVIYNYGWNDVPEDHQQGVEWIRRAAEQGLAAAQSELGVIYLDGIYVPKDYQQAVVLCLKAAEQGDRVAQFKLGLMYSDGKGVPQNYKHAAIWYREAAKRGVIGAQLELALMYANGQGVVKNYPQAYAWYSVVAANGDEANKLRGFIAKELIANDLTPAELSEGESLAKVYIEQSKN